VKGPRLPAPSGKAAVKLSAGEVFCGLAFPARENGQFLKSFFYHYTIWAKKSCQRMPSGVNRDSERPRDFRPEIFIMGKEAGEFISGGRRRRSEHFIGGGLLSRQGGVGKLKKFLSHGDDDLFLSAGL